MRGGRKMDAAGTIAARGASGETCAIWTGTGTRVCRVCGRAWSPQQAQLPLHLSGTSGGACLTTDCCSGAATKERPSHASQCGGKTIHKSMAAQSNHAHARF